MKRLFLVLAACGAGLMPPAVRAEACPALLESARRLALVTFTTMSSPAATLRLFERQSVDDVWRALRPPEPVMLGAKGAAWAEAFRHFKRRRDPVKREGDQRTPAGIFAFGPPFGFAPSPLPDYLHLQPDTVCVDDPQSAAYNTITARQSIEPGVSVEMMRSGPLYRRGLVVQYPTSAATRAGSCIFIHVWKNPTTGTAGCIALPEPRVAALQDFAAEPAAVLAVLPEEPPAPLTRCLPQVKAAPR